MLVEASELVKSIPLGEAIVSVLVAGAAYLNHRSHQATRKSTEARITEVKHLVIGADGKNGVRGTVERLRQDFEREASNAARERRRTQRARVTWSRWRGEIQQAQDTNKEEIDRLRDGLTAVARGVPNKPPELFGNYDQRSGSARG